MTIYLLLFWEFLKTGLFAIVGGLATLPFLYDIASRYDWFDAAILPDMIAISESTPGPIGINMATYAGFNVAGVAGSIIATLAEIIPSIIIILIIARFLEKFKGNAIVQNAFYGLRPAVCALIATAAVQVLETSVLTLDAFKANPGITTLFDLKSLILFVVVMILTHLPKIKKLHPVVFLAASAVVGIIFKMG